MTLAHAQLHPLTPSRSAAIPTRVSIAWEISPRALLAAPGAKVLNGHAARLRSARLALRVDLHDLARAGLSGPCAVHVHLDAGLDRDEHDAVELTMAHVGQWSMDEQTGWLLLDVPGVLHAVIGCDGNGSPNRVVYARTPTLSGALGLPGGVYDAPSLS